MNDPGWHWWDILTPFMSAATAVVTGSVALFSLVAKRFQGVRMEIRSTKTDVDRQIQAIVDRIARQEVVTATFAANELHHSRRLDSIERSVQTINSKQDEQTQILYEIKGKIG